MRARSTIDRQRRALNILGVLAVEEDEALWSGNPVTRWTYRLANGIDPSTLDWDQIRTRNVMSPTHMRERGADRGPLLLAAISGTDSETFETGDGDGQGLPRLRPPAAG